MAELERSAAPRNGLPEFRPYTYKGTGEDIYSPRRVAARLHEQIAARSPEHAALAAGFERRQAERSGADCTGPGAGWDPPDGDELAEVAAGRDRYQAALAAVPDPAPAPPPVTAASRCRRCGYLTTAAGHRVMCDD